MQKLIPWRVLLIAVILVASFAIWNQPIEAQDTKTPETLCEEALPNIDDPETRSFSEAEQVLEGGVDYHAIFCTSQGAIHVDLFEQYTPITVNNFVFLAQQGYYNNSVFHRVIADFMVQGGDPVGNPAGTGGPGYQFRDEFKPFLAFNRPGYLAMANAGPATNGSQFFITRVPTTHLNQRHTIFGEVWDGQEIVDNMTDTEGGLPEPDALHTVLIVTDPSTVETSYEPPAPATGEEVLAAIASGPLPTDPAVTQTYGESHDSETAAERFEGDAQATATSLYETHGLNFEATGFWEITECEQAELLGIGLSVADWDDSESAANFMGDEELVTLETQQGFELLDAETDYLVENGFNAGLLFVKDTSDFCNVDGKLVRYIWNQGQFTFTLDFGVAAALLESGQLSLEDLPFVVVNIGNAMVSPVGEAVLAAD